MRQIHITLSSGASKRLGREAFDLEDVRDARWQGSGFVVMMKDGSGVSFPAHRIHRIDIEKEEPNVAVLHKQPSEPGDGV